jgi:hypothetical protein
LRVRLLVQWHYATSHYLQHLWSRWARQLTFLIFSDFWNFRYRLVRYYWHELVA